MPTVRVLARALAAVALFAAVPTVAGAAQSADDAFALYEEALRQVEARIPPSKLACRDGCAYCCHLKVIVTPAEALRLGRVLRAKLSADELAALSRMKTCP